MQFEIYLDSLFLVNFVMNLYVLLLLNRYCCGLTGILRLVVSAMIGAFGYLLLFLLPIPVALRFCAGIFSGTLLMLRVAFPGRLVGKRLLLYGRAVAVTFFLGGGLLFFSGWFVWFRGKPMGVLLLMGLGFLLCLLYHNTLENHGLTEEQCGCRVILPTSEGERSFPAYVDSGNNLCEPISGKPVSVVSAEILQAVLKEGASLWRLVPYRSIGKRGVLKAYCVKELWIQWNGNRIRVENVFLADGEGCLFDNCREEAAVGVILHPKLLDRKNQGGEYGS